MKNIRLYALEETYHEDKANHEYPTVSYTKDTDKVWYMKNNQIKMMFSITEDDVNNCGGKDLMVWAKSVLFDSVKVDGVEQKMPIQEKSVIITGESTEAEFMFDESCYINDKNINKCDLIFDEPILGDWHKYFLTMSFQGYEDGMWIDYINFTQPLSAWIGEGITDGFIANENSELVGVDLDYLSNGFLDYVGPTARMLVHVVYDENAVQNGETSNFIVNVNEDTLVDSHINMIIGGIPLLSLPTTEARDYEVVVTIYNDVPNMSNMFDNCIGLTSLDLSNFDTSDVTDMSWMFSGCSGLTSLDLSNFDTSNVTSMHNMFNNCRSLTSLDLSNFDTSNVTSMHNMFKSCSGLTSITWGNNFNTSNVTSMDGMFQNCSSLISLDLSSFDTSNVTYMDYMFYGCSGLTSITWGNNFNTSKVIKMNYMFEKCRSLASLDLSNFDVSKVTGSTSMFYACNNLTSFKYFKKTPYKVIQVPSTVISIDLSAWDMSNVTDMGWMFAYCSGLTSLDLSSFDTSNVTNMHYMFSGCSSLTSLDLSNFNTSNVTNMDYMFYGCGNLTSLDLSSFNTSNVTTMCQMFEGCRGLTSLDLSHFDTSNVTRMYQMFFDCRGLTSLDLSNFDTSNVTNMYGMFTSCSGLTSITFGSQADVSQVTSYSKMFYNITTTGTLYYPSAYESAWNNILVTNQSASKFPSTWTATAVDYENQ